MPAHPADPALPPSLATSAPPSRSRRTQASAPEPLLSVAEAATFYGVSTKTIRRLLGGGGLTASRIGRQLRLSRAELLAYLRRQVIEP